MLDHFIPGLVYLRRDFDLVAQPIFAPELPFTSEYDYHTMTNSYALSGVAKGPACPAEQDQIFSKIWFF